MAQRTVSAASRTESALRPDIQGLRALAVLAVLMFHLWPVRITGGYVGVDVFFVISGFLITSHLLREMDATGRIRIGVFWARRAKRLLPASLLVLAVTSVAILLVVPKTLWRQFLAEVAASTLYVQNWLLGYNSVDYMAADNTPSPVQHFWTLSVEEQFYIVLPLLLIGTLVIAKWRKWPVRRVALTMIAVATIGSFAYSVWLTHWSESSAYFSTLTRAWEFGVGALIVALPQMRSAIARTVASAAGLAAILAAVFLFGPQTSFPGYAAALPVLGAATVLWAGSRTFADTIGGFAPVAFVGRISYAVYLWHWPPIVLLPYITGTPLTTLQKVAILAGTLVVAWLSTTFWEDRVRFSPRLLGNAKPRLVAAWSAAAMALVLVVPATTAVVLDRESARLAEIAAEIEAGNPDCFGAAALAEPGCVNPDLEGILVPAPADLSEDDGNRSECWSRGGDATLNVCTVGPSDHYERHLLAVGDSHNNSLVGAYEQIANANNWRIDVAGRAGCYWTDAELVQPNETLTVECADWRSSLQEYISQSRNVDAIITTKARRPLSAEVGTADPSAAFREIVDGMASAWAGRPDLDVPVIAIVDNPWLPSEARECIMANGLAAATVCAIPRSAALPPDGIAEAAAASENVHLIDLTDLYCTADTCAPVVGNVIVYRDGRHITGTYARTIAPFLGAEVEATVENRD